MLQQVAVGLGADRVDGHVGPQMTSDLLQQYDDILVLGEVVGLRVGERAGLGQAVLQLVDHDDATGAHQPGRSGG